MSSFFDSAVQLKRLDRNREALVEAKTDLLSLNRRIVLPKLILYELARRDGTEKRGGGPQVERMLLALLEMAGEISQLTAQDLLDVYSLLWPSKATGYREGATSSRTPSHEPLAPEVVPRAVDRFFEWVASPAFAELHPVQQMTVAQMRLYGIEPFPEESQLAVSLFSQYFLCRNGYLLALYEPETAGRFDKALDEAFRFSTEALMELNIQACLRSYQAVRDEAGL